MVVEQALLSLRGGGQVCEDILGVVPDDEAGVGVFKLLGQGGGEVSEGGVVGGFADFVF